MSNVATRCCSLVSRSDEVNLLCQSFQRVSKASSGGGQQVQELLLIRGASGTGKTALANSLKRHCSLFVSGKFQVSTLQDPYAVFVSAVTQLVEALLLKQSDKQEEHQRLEYIRKAFGTEGKWLANIIPALDTLLLGDHKPVREGDGSNTKGVEALQRFQFLFCKLIRIVSTLSPLVIFLDDLQWGDTASLELVRALLLSGKGYPNSKLLVIGAYREEGMEHESNPRNSSPTKSREASLPFSRYLKLLCKLGDVSQIKLTTIHLQNLDESSTNQLVADYLGMETGSTISLGAIVFARCLGNPYHVLQVLDALVSQGSLHRTNGGWNWNDVDIAASWGSEETIHELLARKLSLLPELSRKVLQVSACMGDDIDVGAVAVVLDAKHSDVELSIQAATAEGHLIYNTRSCRSQFSHDRVRQAVLSMIGDDRDSLSYTIGHQLWTCPSSALFLNEKLYVIANLLNCGIHRMEDRAERYRAASLNLEAGIKAASLAAFPDSSRYLNAGIEFLQGGNYWSDKYDLTLNIFNAAADTAVCLQNFSRVFDLVGEVLQHARTVHDKIPAIVAKINAFGQHGSIPRAIEVGIQVLCELDEPLPRQATEMAIILEVVRTKLTLRGRSTDAILRLDHMSNRRKLDALHILTALMPYTYQAGSFFNPLVGTRIVRLSLRFGLHQSCALGFSTLGWVLCGSDRKMGYRLGTIALTIIERARAKELIPRVHMFFYGFIHHWRRPLRHSLEPLQNAVQVGLERGDVEYACLALFFKCSHSMACGLPLAEIDRLLVDTMQLMEVHKQNNIHSVAKFMLQFVHNMTGRALHPNILVGEIIGEDFAPDEADKASVKVTWYGIGSNVAFRFGDYDLAHQLSEKRRQMAFEPFALFSFTALRQTEALLAIARARLDLDKRKGYRLGRKVLKQFKAWAADCPENFLCKRYMIEAELKSLKPGKKGEREIRCLYEHAIELAQSQGYTHEAALACELAGDYMKRQDSVIMATKYLGQAHSLYLAWGASAKAGQLSRLLF